MRFRNPSPDNPVLVQAFKGSRANPTIRGKRVTRPLQLRTTIERYEDQGFSVYVVMNPVVDDFDGEFPSKDDIAGRSLFLLDIDPTRNHPDGGKIAATDEEKTEAFKQKEEIKQDLAAEGWPTPGEVDSGNGYYLLYETDAPADSPLFKPLTRCIAEQHPNDAAHVDTGVHNANRIIRAPGSLNNKGPGTEDRPHRECKVIAEPEGVLTEEQMKAYCDKYEYAPDPTYETPVGETPIKKAQCLQRYLADHGFRTTMRVDNTKNRVFLDFARCPFRGSCDANAAVIVHPHSEHYDSIGFHCFEGNHCGGRKWKDLQEQIGVSFLVHMGGVDPKPKTETRRKVTDPVVTAERLQRAYNKHGVPGIAIIAGDLCICEGDKWIKPTKHRLAEIATQKFEQVALERAEWEAKQPKEAGKQIVVHPSSTSITTNILASLRANAPTYYEGEQQIPPQFFFGGHDWDAADVRRCRNGDLNLRRYIEGEKDYFRPHSPQLYTRQLIECDFDPDAPIGESFQGYLDSLELTDAELTHMQQVVAYAAYPLERRDKFIVHTGPRRAGKGVLEEIMVFLVGGDAVMHPIDFSDLTTENGMQASYDCLFLKVDEASAKIKGMPQAVKRIKEFTGGSAIQVSGKWMIAKKIKPNFIVWVISNERIAFVDDSEAINGRQLLIEFRESFFGREDLQLSTKLADPVERSGILNWSLRGLKELHANKWQFNIPESWAESADELTRQAVPLREFVSECLVKDPTYCLPMEAVKAMHDSAGIEDEKPKDTLRKELQALGFRVTQLGSADSETLGNQVVAITEAGLGRRQRPYVVHGHKPNDKYLKFDNPTLDLAV